MIKESLKELWAAVNEDFGWWFCSVLLGFAQPYYQQVRTGNSLTMLGLSENFILYLAPTVLGCLLAVYKSVKPLKEKWVIVMSSLLFNGYVLESLCEMFGYLPNSFGYFLGGLIAYWVFDLLFQLLEELKPKGLPLIWRFLKNKANLDNVDLGSEQEVIEEEVKPKKEYKRKKKNDNELH